MQVGNRESFQIGDWQVEPGLNLISRGGHALSLRPRVIELLVYLSARAGEVVSVDEIIDQVWGGVFVTNGAIYNCINELRDAFEDHNSVHEYIETISKRGYRVVAPVVFADREEAARTTGSRVRRRTQILASLLVAAIAAIIVLSVQTREPTAISDSQIFSGSIAILPFKDLSPDGEQEYFADGITEELLNALAGVEGLKVAARTSSFYFKGRDPAVAEIRQTLGVAHILEGSVRRSGNRIRITAQLIDSDSGFHLWSETYDRELVDIFSIQDEISAAIVVALRGQLDLDRGDMGDPRNARVVDPEAYSEYLLGRYLLNRRKPQAFDAAIRHLRKAVETDESYAPAHANLAIAYGLNGSYGLMSRQDAIKLAQPHADRAMQLDPELAEAHGAMYYLEFLRDIHDSEFRHLKRAIALNPSYMDARNWKANELLGWQRYEEAIVTRKTSLEIDPLSIIHNFNFAGYLLRTGRSDEVKILADRLKSIDSEWGYRITGNIAYDQGDVVTAVSVYLIGLRSTPRQEALLYRLGEVLSELGLAGEAGRVFPDLSFYWSVLDAYNAGDWVAVQRLLPMAIAKGRDNPLIRSAIADVQYLSRDFATARLAYVQILSKYSELGFLPDEIGISGIIFYAVTLGLVGAEDEAKIIFEQASDYLKNQEKAGHVDGNFFHLKGLAFLYQGQLDEAFDAFEQAFDKGHRDDTSFVGALFDPVRQHPRFVTLQGKYKTTKRENRAAVLALICGGDLPDIGWLPLPETCEDLAVAGSN